MLGEPDNGTVICARSGARTILQAWGAAHRTTFVKTAEMLYVTAYLPDSGHTMEEYETTAKQVESIVRCHNRVRGRFRRRVVIGGDFSIPLMNDIAGVTGSVVEQARPRRGKVAVEWATKHEMWVQLCLTNNIEAWTTSDFNKAPQLGEEEKTTTNAGEPGEAGESKARTRGHHAWWGHGGFRTQIDVIHGDRDACQTWGSDNQHSGLNMLSCG